MLYNNIKPLYKGDYMGKHNPHGQSQDKDRHDKKRHDENINRNHSGQDNRTPATRDDKDSTDSQSSINPDDMSQ